VTRGETIALTTPTWAPVLSIDLSTDHFAYRQSRSRNCNSPPSTTQAQTQVGQGTRYVCDYPGTRVEYSATEVTNPVPTKTTTTPPAKTKKATRKIARKR
jgi:6-phosphogluconolactonase (cycloisomerase 2 family)